MEWVIVAVCLLMLTACTALIVRTARENDEKGENGRFENDGNISREDCKTAQKRRERAKDAYYMRNFWNYDGSEQQDWDEEE